MCNSSDVPATRKVGGFVGHGALKACSRCLKNFETARFGEKPDYSGFNPDTWPKRTAEEHQQKGREWKLARTQTERQKIERDCGVRYKIAVPIYFKRVAIRMRDLSLDAAVHVHDGRMAKETSGFI